MTPSPTRVVQLLSKFIYMGLFWMGGKLTGSALTEDATLTLQSLAEGAAFIIAGLVTFLFDLWLHRLQKKTP